MGATVDGAPLSGSGTMVFAPSTTGPSASTSGAMKAFGATKGDPIRGKFAGTLIQTTGSGGAPKQVTAGTFDFKVP